ncbi:MAG: glycosyltransferase family 4 protein [Planctomycetota bacterium]
MDATDEVAEIVHACALKYLQSGHEVKVFTTHDPKGEPRGTLDGIPLQSFPVRLGVDELLSGFENPKITRVLLESLRTYKPDVIHAHNIHSALGWAWIPRIKAEGAQVGLTFHDHMAITRGKLVPPSSAQPGGRHKHNVVRELMRYRTKSSPMRSMKIRRIAAIADWRTAVSDSLVDLLEEHGIGGVRRIYNGIDISTHALVPPPQNPGLIFLGRPTHEKGVEALLQGARLSTLSMRIVICSPLSDPLMKLAKKIAGGKVTLEFPGWVTGDSKRQLIEGCTAVANLSIYPDPFNLTNLEGMERARPILGTLWGGTPEVVRQGVDGWLVDPRHPSDVAQAIRAILKDPAECARRGGEGRQRVVDSFQWKDILPQYLRLVEGGASPGSP